MRPAAQGSAPLGARAALAALLLVGEYLVVSLLADLPTLGPARPLADAVRVIVPVLLGAVAAAGLLFAAGLTARAAALEATLPAWRPWPRVAAQLVAFVGLAASARALFGPEAAVPDAHLLAAWLAGAVLTGLLGVSVAVPLPWLARAMARGASLPAAAIACGLVAWRAAAAAEAAWGELSGRTLRGIAGLLALAGARPDVDLAARVIGVGEFYVEIAPECSGADGIGLVLVFQGLWLALRRHHLRLGRALLLLPLGAAAAFGANVVRLAALVLIGASGAEELALGGFHSKAGWILFLALSLAGVAVSERWRWLHRPAPAAGPASVPLLPDSAVALLAPLLAMLAAALATDAVSGGPLDRLYGVRVAAALAALAAARSLLPRPSFAADPRPALAGAVVAAVWVLAPGGDGAALEAGLRALAPAERAAWIAVKLAGSVLVVPLVEELAFRGFLLPWLAARADGEPRRLPWGAVLVSSAAFGALHASFLLGAAAGVAFALARLWRGRLADAVLAHAVANAGVAAAVLAFGRWDLWA